MAKKPYSPVAPYAELKRVEQEIEAALTVEKIQKIVAKDGPKVGYKAFCYMLGGKMTPEGMKPDEACAAAEQMEAEGKFEEATEIYRRVVAVVPDHPLAKEKVG
jgi:hypothetical protein